MVTNIENNHGDEYIVVGDRYLDSIKQRETVVRVDGVDIEFTENLWECRHSSSVETDYGWCITAKLNLPKKLDSNDACASYVENNMRVLKALSFLDYELREMEEEGVGIWEKPAPNHKT